MQVQLDSLAVQLAALQKTYQGLLATGQLALQTKLANKSSWQAYEASLRQFEFGGLDDQCNTQAYPAMESLISQNN